MYVACVQCISTPHHHSLNLLVRAQSLWRLVLAGSSRSSSKMLSRGCLSFMSAKKLFPVVLAGVARAKHTLPDLPYDYNGLEPTISAEIMQLHHQKHHATYVNNLNVAEEKLAEAQTKGGTKLKIIS